MVIKIKNVYEIGLLNNYLQQMIEDRGGIDNITDEDFQTIKRQFEIDCGLMEIYEEEK